VQISEISPVRDRRSTTKLHHYLAVRVYVGQGEGRGDRLTSRPVVSSRVDYCDTESFRASCNSQDEVVMIERAVYGRMRLGRCVEMDMGHVGCQSNVLQTAVCWAGHGARGLPVRRPPDRRQTLLWKNLV